jgi:hypothetical protein
MIGWEPNGRIGISLIETTSVLLLLSSYYIAGALISLSIIRAANFLHFAKLGFVVNEDGRTLFAISIIVIICSLWIVIHWNRSKPRRQVRFETPEPSEEDF